MRTVLIFMVSTLAFAGTAGAEVYKWVDKDGKVHYSDQPRQGAQPAELKPLTTVEPVKVNPRDEAADAAPERLAEGYAVFKIVRPAAGETVSNIGTVLVVQIELEPGLQEGHQLFLTYDGKRYQTSGTTATLTEVFRGTHTLSAEVVDASGNVIASTGAMSFTVQQSSTLPKPKPKPPKK